MIILVIGLSISDIVHNNIVYSQDSICERYDKVPKTLDDWPTSVNIRCWCCREFFKTKPIPIPIRCDSTGFVNKGIACSLICAKSYILTYKDPDIDQKNIMVHLRTFQNACTKLGYDCVGIPTKAHFYENADYGSM